MNLGKDFRKDLGGFNIFCSILAERSSLRLDLHIEPAKETISSYTILAERSSFRLQLHIEQAKELIFS